MPAAAESPSNGPAPTKSLEYEQVEISGIGPFRNETDVLVSIERVKALHLIDQEAKDLTHRHKMRAHVTAGLGLFILISYIAATFLISLGVLTIQETTTLLQISVVPLLPLVGIAFRDLFPGDSR